MRNILKILSIAMLLFIADTANAVDFTPPPPVQENIPIDGGLSWLLAAGGIYGVSKLRKNLKK